MDERVRERRIRTALDREAGHEVRRANLWPAIQRQLAVEQAGETAAAVRGVSSSRRFASRPAFASFALLLIALLAFVVILPTLLNHNSPAPPSSPAITQSASPTTALPNLAHDPMPAAMAARAQVLGLQRTVGRYTVTLLRVYLDPHTLTFSYAVSGPGTGYVSEMGTLSNDQGVKLTGAGWQTGNQVVDGTTTYGLARFDPSPAVSSSLSLYLNMQLMRSPKIEISSVSPPLTPNLTQDVAGSFVFAFTAPLVTVQQNVTVGQQVTIAGTSVTLEQARLTPGGSQLVLRYAGPGYNPALAWQPDLSLTPAGQQVVFDNAIEIGKQADGSWLYVSHAALYDHPGPCTVTITALHGYDTTNRTYAETQLTGPWTFQFTIPPP